MPALKEILWKSFRWLLIAIAILAIVIITSFYFWGTSFAKKQLSDLLEQKTNGQYEVSFSKIKVNPFTRNLSFDDLTIGTTNKDSLKFKFHFSSKTLKFEKINLFAYWHNSELSIGRLKIQGPTIQVSNKSNPESDQESVQELIQLIRPFFNTYFSSLSIKNIELSNAGFLNKIPSAQLLSTKKTINFNVGIKAFYTDSAVLTTPDYFEAEDVYLSVDNYQKTLSDNIHLLQVQQLIYSIKNKGIEAVNVKLNPTDSTSLTSTLYWVELPQLRIQSKKIDEILQEDTIRIDTLELKSTRIRVLPPTNAPGINFRELKQFDLYELVKDEFGQLNIGVLKLDADRLQIERKKEAVTNKQVFEGLKVELSQFQLDSLSSSNTKKILYSDQVFIKVNQYTIELNDQVHKFSANQIIADSRRNSIGADQLKMWADDPKSTITKITLNCDSIRMNSVDMMRLYHFREMPLNEIAAYKPLINIEQGDRKKKTHHPGSNSLLYNFISNYIKGIYANLITIDQGRFKVTSLENDSDSSAIESDFSFRLTDFSLDSISANKTDKLFFATNIDLVFNNYQMKLQDQLHFLNMDKIEVSSIQKSATIRNLHLFPVNNENGLALLKKHNRSGLFNIRIPILYLKNTNVHHAFFNKKLNINYFSIVEPNIRFELNARNKKSKSEFDLNDFYDLLKTYINDIKIGQLKIPNGQFQLVNHDRRGKTISFDNKFNLELEGVRFNDDELEKDRLLFSDQFELVLKDHLFKLSDKVHYLQLKEIGFSTRKNEVFVKNAVLYPDITSPKYNELPRHLQINIPEFILEGIDIRKAYFSKELVVKKFNINHPDIKIYQTDHTADKLNLKDFTLPLPEEIKLLSLKELNLTDGHISMLKTRKQQHHEIASLDINLTGTEVSLQNKGDNQAAKLNALNVNSTLKNLMFTPDLGKYTFNIAQLDYSQSSKKIHLKDFNISLKPGVPKNGFISTSIKTMDINGLQTINNHSRNIVHTKSIVAEGAILNFTKSNEDKRPANLYGLKLNEDLLTLMDELSSESIKVNNAEVNIDNEKRKRQFKNINLTLNDFKLTEKPSGKLLGAANLDLSLTKLNDTDKNKWYDLSCNEFRYTSSPSTLSFRGVKVDPRYSKDEFQQASPFQMDYYAGEIGQIKCTGFDLKKYLDTKELTGNQILFENARFDIYRDLRKPFNEDQRPAMPQDIIRNYKLPFYFDSVKVVSSDISYSEQMEEMPDPGTIRFQNIKASLYPFTNMEYMLNQNPTINLTMNTLLYGETKLSANMQFNMLSGNNDFSVTGQLSPFNMSILNPMTRNAALITIRSGDLQRFEFEFNADNVAAKGKLKFAYDDLKINILSLKDGDTKESKFASFLANSLMIKSKNPRTKILLPDQIYFERDKKRSILNYWWKSIFSGAKNTFGIKEKDD